MARSAAMTTAARMAYSAVDCPPLNAECGVRNAACKDRKRYTPHVACRMLTISSLRYCCRIVVTPSSVRLTNRPLLLVACRFARRRLFGRRPRPFRLSLDGAPGEVDLLL